MKDQLNDKTPLLRKEVQQSINNFPANIDANVHERAKHGKGNYLTSTMNLAMSAIGAGILSYPYAVKNSGIVLNFFWTVIFALPVFYTLILFRKFAQRRMEQMHMFTFEELTYLMLGTSGYNFAVFWTLINQIGSLTGFMIIIADVTHPVLREWLGDDSFFATRAFAVIGFALIILPLSFLKDLHGLTFSSVIGIGSVVAVVGLLVYQGVFDIIKHKVEWEKIDIYYNWGLHMFVSPPICVFSLGCHLQVIPIYAELKQSSKHLMDLVSFSVEAFCVILYTAAGVFGYLAFNQDTDGDVLLNFSLGDVFADVAKLLMALHVTLAFPVLLLPTKRTISYLLYRYANLYDVAPTKISQSDSFVKVPSQKVAFISGMLVLLGTAVMAIFVPEVAVIFGLVGSTASVAIMFFVPALMLIYDDQPFTSEFSRTAQAVILLVVSALTAVVGTGVTIQQTYFK